MITFVDFSVGIKDVGLKNMVDWEFAAYLL